jgi:predicted phage terminase large subunit-like protein
VGGVVRSGVDFQIIPPDLLALASPAERRAYELALARHVALLSPLDYALATREDALEYRHSRFISDVIAKLPPDGKVILLMPPRHGKSYLLSETVPAWALGNNPNAAVIHVTYAHDFTTKFGRKTRNLMQLAASRSLAPRLDPSAKAADNFLVHPSEGSGFYVGTGVGGQITGLPADWLLMDDLVKNKEEADSKVVRDKTWDWFVEDAMTRLEPGSRAVLLGTPRHEDDVLGRAAATGEWEVIRLPALAEDDDPLGRERGEALCPERYTVSDLEQIRQRRPSTFTSLYQCRPAPEDGDVFKDKNLLTYTQLPDVPGRRFAVVDTAHSTKRRADYTVLTLFFASAPPNPKLYVTHVFRERVESGEHIEWVDRCIRTLERPEWPSFIGVEDKTFGSTMLSTARRFGRNGMPMFRALVADTDKVSRAQTAAALSTQGQLLLLQGAPWEDDARREMLSFPNGLHDDIVDTISYGAIEFSKGRPSVKPEPQAKPLPTVPEKIAAQIKRMNRKPSARASRKSLMR